MRRLIATTLGACVLSLAPAVHAAETRPSGASTCTYTVKKRISAAAALRNGIPVTLRCTGPATVGIGGSLWGRRVREHMAEHYDTGSPGEALMVPPRTVGPGTTVIRERVRPWARGIFRRLAPFSVHTGVAVKGADGRFRGFSNKTTRVTR